MQTQKRNGHQLNAKAIKQNQKRNRPLNASGIKQTQKRNRPLNANVISRPRKETRVRYGKAKRSTNEAIEKVLPTKLFKATLCTNQRISY
ncbi:hypothetical protein EMCRGX_G027708 [Ephydatia muelleri]